MEDTTLYTIGHGRRTIEDFIEALKKYNIQYLLDIRSKPYSKWNPLFNEATLPSLLKKNGIRYHFAGGQLGGLPDDRSCYDENGKIVYSRVREKDFFQKGVQRLLTAHEKKLYVALMCSEAKPEECHRSKLIGEELYERGISLNHIDADGRIKSQQTVMNNLTKGGNLFGGEEFFSRKSYTDVEE